MILRYLAPDFKEGSGVALCGVMKIVKFIRFANIKSEKTRNLFDNWQIHNRRLWCNIIPFFNFDK